MYYFAIIALILGIYQASGQYQWSYVAPPIFYQSPQIYNPFAPVQQFYQTPVFYHTPQQNVVPPQVSKNAVPPQQDSRSFHNEIQNQNKLNPETFRGFGYRTAFDDGATSTVVFLSGPQSSTQIFKAKSSVTIASDILDPQSSKNIQEQLKKTNEERQGKAVEVPEDPLSRIRAFLENPSLINEGITFFSADGYPANTAPLNKTKSTTPKQTIEEQEPAESVLHHSTINEIPSVKKETTTTTTTQEATTLDDITVTTEQELKTESPTTMIPSESTEETTDAATTTSQ